MLSHKFHVRQLVQLNLSIGRNVPGGSYEITKKLPEREGEFEYRIKSMNEPHERVARESELHRRVVRLPRRTCCNCRTGLTRL